MTAPDVATRPFPPSIGTCNGIPDSLAYENLGTLTITIGDVHEREDLSHYCTSDYQFN